MIKTNLAPHFEPSKRTQRPVVTGTSVLAVKYKGGIMMMADTLGSYGRMSRFRNIQRLVKVGESTLLGASGDISDFQAVLDMLERKRVEDVCVDDGAKIDSKEILTFLSRVLYQRRNKFDLLWNDLVVGGFVREKGSVRSVLGVVDKLGTVYEENFIATGFGAHLALPLIREKWNANMTEQEAAKLLEDCMRVLYYRDCRTINKIQRATVAEKDDAVVVSKPYVLETEWAYKSFVDPKAGVENGGSW